LGCARLTWFTIDVGRLPLGSVCSDEHNDVSQFSNARTNQGKRADFKLVQKNKGLQELHTERSK
jgi:hypothetical protein